MIFKKLKFDFFWKIWKIEIFTFSKFSFFVPDHQIFFGFFDHPPSSRAMVLGAEGFGIKFLNTSCDLISINLKNSVFDGRGCREPGKLNLQTFKRIRKFTKPNRFTSVSSIGFRMEIGRWSRFGRFPPKIGFWSGVRSPPEGTARVLGGFWGD